MKLTYLEIDGIQFPVVPELSIPDENEQTIANVLAAIDRVEAAEATSVSLSTACSFAE